MTLVDHSNNNSNSSVVAMADHPTSMVVMVTPELAEQWLSVNARNRAVREYKVIEYALDMMDGNWLLTGESIKFSVSGRLLDGQHRLLAVIEAETPVAMFVTRGLPQDTQSVMDTGIRRRAADNLHIHGERNPQTLAAAARIGCVVDRGLLYRDAKLGVVSHAQIYEWITTHPALRRSVDYVLSGEPRKIDLRPAVRAYCHYRLAQLDPDPADEFFCLLGSLVNIPAGSPIHALSSRLRQLDRQRVKAETRDLIGMTFRAWNAWRQGRPLHKIPLVAAPGTKTLPDLT